MPSADDRLVQMTLVQIDNYGPSNNTLGDDREYKLQSMQSELYSFVEKNFAEKDGLVFYNRFDEMLAISNGIGVLDHLEIGKRISAQFPITVSMGIGLGRTPFEAQLKASRLLQGTGSAQSKERRGALAHEATVDLSRSYAQVVHIDVDRITRTFTDKFSAYETSLGVMSLYVDLMKRLREYGALLFFIGGDNFMGLADGVTAEQMESLLRVQESRDDGGGGMKLKCGMGVASTGRKAAELATGNLEKIRETDRGLSVMSTVQLH